MANQARPSRPWLILGSTRPLPLPPPPAAQAQPPAARPTVGQAFRPTNSQPVGINVSSVSSYPSSQKAPPPEKIKPPSPSPSPSTLPLPPQPIEQKPNPPLIKTSINGGPLQKDVAGPPIAMPTINVPGYEEREQIKEEAECKDNSILIITINGENRGCLMELKGCPASLGNAFVINSNINVQAVKNSILLNTCCSSTHDPARLHVFFSRARGGDL